MRMAIVVEGTDPGASSVAGARALLIWTTLVSAILFAILDLLYVYRVASLERPCDTLGPAGNNEPQSVPRA